jgi:hypothetical protein
MSMSALKEGVVGMDKLGTEDQRGGRAMTKQFLEKQVRHVVSISGVFVTSFFGPDVSVQPVKKGRGLSCKSTSLGKMDVTIDGSGDEQSIRAVDDVSVGMGREELVGRSDVKQPSFSVPE